jgi:hypothetical protein
LTPTGHTRVYEARVPRQTGVRSNSQSLGDAGSKPFDQHIRLRRHSKDDLLAGGLLEIQCHGASVAQERRILRRIRTAPNPIDPHDFGAHVSEHHAAVRRRTEPRYLDHFHPGQRPCHCSFLICTSAAQEPTGAPPFHDAASRIEHR